MKQISPLANAIFHKHSTIAEALLQHGARPDFVDSTGKNGAVYAAANGETEILRIILDSGDEVVAALDAQYAHDLTLLMWAAGYGNTAAVSLLISRGARFDLTDDRGKTALMMAAENGHAEVVRFLIESGADSDIRDRDGRTARDLSEIAGQSETARILN
jgi:ankyrin repeat protein